MQDDAQKISRFLPLAVPLKRIHLSSSFYNLEKTRLMVSVLYSPKSYSPQLSYARSVVILSTLRATSSIPHTTIEATACYALRSWGPDCIRLPNEHGVLAMHTRCARRHRPCWSMLQLNFNHPFSRSSAEGVVTHFDETDNSTQARVFGQEIADGCVCLSRYHTSRL